MDHSAVDGYCLSTLLSSLVLLATVMRVFPHRLTESSLSVASDGRADDWNLEDSVSVYAQGLGQRMGRDALGLSVATTAPRSTGIFNFF